MSASARPDSAVRPEFGPSLPQLLRARLGVPPLVSRAIAAALILAAVVVALLLRGNDVQLVHRSPPSPGVLLDLEGRRGDLFVQSLTIRPLHLPAYRGSVSGMLPVYAEPHVRAVSRRYDGFVALEEGKARINDAPGYQVGFRARLGRRTIYGREILLVPDQPGAREGVVITVVQTHAAGAHSVDDVGAVGAIKKPLRSFRFGTEAN